MLRQRLSGRKQTRRSDGSVSPIMGRGTSSAYCRRRPGSAHRSQVNGCRRSCEASTCPRSLERPPYLASVFLFVAFLIFSLYLLCHYHSIISGILQGRGQTSSTKNQGPGATGMLMVGWEAALPRAGPSGAAPLTNAARSVMLGEQACSRSCEKRLLYPIVTSGDGSTHRSTQLNHDGWHSWRTHHQPCHHPKPGTNPGWG